MDFEKLAKVAVAESAAAVGLDLSINGAANTPLDLPVEKLKVLGEYLFKGNPLKFYTSKLKPEATGKGSIEMWWTNSVNAWSKKTVYGNGITKNGTDFSLINKPKIEKETIYWNGSLEMAEAMRASDLQRGALNVLPERMATDFIKAMIDGQRYMFEIAAGQITDALATAVPDHTGDGVEVFALDIVATSSHDTVQERGAKLLKSVTDAAITYLEARNLNRSDVLITMEPLHFNTLAFAGLIGDKVTKTFNGGMYTVGTAGGFNIQSGESMLAKATITDGALLAGDTGKVKSTLVPGGVIPGGTTYGKTICMIGTADAMAYNHSIIAANVGKIGNTNDLESYAEYDNITAIPTRTKTLGLLAFMIEPTV